MDDGRSCLEADDATNELNISRHDGDSLSVNGAEVGVLEEMHEMSLGGLQRFISTIRKEQFQMSNKPLVDTPERPLGIDSACSPRNRRLFLLPIKWTFFPCDKVDITNQTRERRSAHEKLRRLLVLANFHQRSRARTVATRALPLSPRDHFLRSESGLTTSYKRNIRSSLASKQWLSSKITLNRVALRDFLYIRL